MLLVRKSAAITALLSEVVRLFFFDVLATLPAADMWPTIIGRWSGWLSRERALLTAVSGTAVGCQKFRIVKARFGDLQRDCGESDATKCLKKIDNQQKLDRRTPKWGLYFRTQW